MKIVVLDRSAMGEDTPVEILGKFGDLDIYNYTENGDIVPRCKDANVIVLNKCKLDSDVLRQLKNLKLICVFATGYDNIDINAARKQGIAVCNVPSYSTDSVVICTIANVLALNTKLYEYNQFVRSGEYSKSGVPNRLIPVYHEIKGKTWGIVGFGNIGRAVAKVAEALGANVIVNKRTPTEEYPCVDIDELCSKSDIITLHCPLNSETKHIINNERISLMKRNVIIVNEARGAVVDEVAIRDAIMNDRIAAFGSDVYSTEPFSIDHPYDSIKEKSNVLLTPHSAWGAYEARIRCLNIICENIEDYFDGKIRNRVDI